MNVTRIQGPGAAKLAKLLASLKDQKAEVGWFENAKYPEGTPVAYVASVQEFGCPSKNIPPRSFMRPTIIAHENEWREGMKQGAAAIVKGSASTETVMTQIGGKVSGDIHKAISEITSPKLKDRTVKARKRKMADTATTGSLTKPLVFTGRLLNTLTFVVGDK